MSKERVHSEWLFHIPTKRESLLFSRVGSRFNVKPVFKEGKDLESRTRNNALFLSVAAQFNGRTSKRILDWFRSTRPFSGLQDVVYRDYTVGRFSDTSNGERIESLLKALDLGIAGFEVESVAPTGSPPHFDVQPVASRMVWRPMPQNNVITTIHKKYDHQHHPAGQERFDFDRHESEGTKKLFALAGMLLDALDTGRLLVIDELDSRLHPILTQAIIGLFQSVSSNPRNAQLVFTTHDTNLLSRELFRRDQIWFIEKDRYGAAHLHSLAEYQGVRNDASFEKVYLDGRYGGVPYVRSVERIVAEFYDAKSE